jgi:hypothetical protein
MTDRTDNSTTEDRFAPLAGEDRLCGVEIEFAGLTEIAAAEIARQCLGGRVERAEAHVAVLHDSRLGRVRVELDTALRKLGGGSLVQQGLDVLRGLIPVEIVTEPLDSAGIAMLDALREDLRVAGALGSRHGLLLGFGVHLNPARQGEGARVARVATAYALLEDHIRRRRHIDTTRRVLPFVDPWPAGLTDDLVAVDHLEIPALLRLYARHTQSRNHGLDLLPLLHDAAPELYAETFPGATDIAARPAYHFRLPDCRIDEAGWSLAEPWEDWLTIERVADDPDMLHRLAVAWRAHRAHHLEGRGSWADTVAAIVEDRSAA